jgi:hypothetical protein
MSHTPSDWESSKGLANAILHDRGMRRKWMGRLVLLTVCWLAAGLWLLDDWLGEEIWRFLAWWGTCGVLTLILLVFALYDSLAVIREERSKDK